MDNLRVIVEKAMVTLEKWNAAHPIYQVDGRGEDE